MVKILIPAFSVVFILVLLFLGLKSAKIKENMIQPSPTGKPTVINKKQTSVIVGDTEIEVEIADNAISRAQGLSGRESLGENNGMLFVFPSKTRGSFWMKGMKIPLDIIWISDGKVNQITKDVPPELNTPLNKLKLYVPDDPYEYVIEVNAGFSDKNGISPGDDVKIISSS